MFFIIDSLLLFFASFNTDIEWPLALGNVYKRFSAKAQCHRTMGFVFLDSIDIGYIFHANNSMVETVPVFK